MTEHNKTRHARLDTLDATVEAIEARINGARLTSDDPDSIKRDLAEMRSEVALLKGRSALAYRGIWQAGADYRQGEFCTWGGSMWHCNAATRQRPGDGASRDWTLCVKKGSDGRNGKDATA